MDDSAKETVIIVHGTWAGLEQGAPRWYQPLEGDPAADGFIAKLDAALHERGSPARCWAHCTEGDPIFHWSPGENSWVARTNAASALKDYIIKVQNEGWRCHIVAHSHGGNVVAEAFSQSQSTPKSSGLLGKIVTLGTPFIDTMTPVTERAERTQKIVGFVPTAFIITILIAYFITLIAKPAHFDYLYIFAVIYCFSIILLCLYVYFDGAKQSKFSASFDNNDAKAQPLFLAIGSKMDEAWQILHHMRNSDNPLAIRANVLKYIFLVLRFRISTSAKISRIRGAKTWRDVGMFSKVVLIVTHIVTITWLTFLLLFAVVQIFWNPVPVPENARFFESNVFALMLVFIYLSLLTFIPVVIATTFFSFTLFSAYLSPFRWCARLTSSIGSIPTALASYVVRRNAWSMLQTMAMGLEGYQFKLPQIEHRPGQFDDDAVIYEDIPKGAEDRALNERSAWISRHFGDLSQTFAKMTVTAADITSLLRIVEADQSLVHGAYYTDEECIARIADWIAGRG